LFHARALFSYVYPDAFPPVDETHTRYLLNYYLGELRKKVNVKERNVCQSIHEKLCFSGCSCRDQSFLCGGILIMFFVPNFMESKQWRLATKEAIFYKAFRKLSEIVLFPYLLMVNGLETVGLKITVFKTLSVQNIIFIYHCSLKISQAELYFK
jgi:hypothetical protein